MPPPNTDASTYGMGVGYCFCVPLRLRASDGESYSGGNRPLSSKHKV
jgi:hypothetical protein